MITCPKCKCVLEVRLTAAPPMQSTAEKGKIGELLDRVNHERLNMWEREFIEKLLERYVQYGERVLLTEKQCEVLERIAEK